MFTLSHKLSAMSFGQDRYRRRYWVLPKCGGIFVEGLESGEPESADPNAPEVDKKIEESVVKDQCFKPVSPANAEESSVKREHVETSCMPADTDCISESKLKTEDLTIQTTVDNDVHNQQLPVCDNIDLKSDGDQAESLVIKQEGANAEADNCSALKAELVSLNCLIGSDVKVNGDMSMMDCKNGFVDLKNCIRSDGDCVKIEPLPVPSLSATVSDPKQGNLDDDSSMDVKTETSTAHLQLVSVTANTCESATNDSIQSSLCCKADDDQRPQTPSKDDISLLHQSSMLQLAVSNAGLAQFGVTDSQNYSVASSQRTSQVATPSSELGTGTQLDLSTAGTPVSIMQPSRTSTPAYLSTSFADDFQLSADGELQPDYLAVPQNVEPISLGNLHSFVSVGDTNMSYDSDEIREREKEKQRDRRGNYI